MVYNSTFFIEIIYLFHLKSFFLLAARVISADFLIINVNAFIIF